MMRSRRKKRRLKEMRGRLAAWMLAAVMALLLAGMLPVGSGLTAITAQAATTYDVSSGQLTINSSNKDTYDGATITGTKTVGASDVSDTFSKDGYITIDGVEVSLTLSDATISVTAVDSSKAMYKAGIALKNGAKLTLTLEGANTLKGGYGAPGIHVPEGTKLTIAQASTGSLNVTGGNASGGAAGIGAWSCGWSAAYNTGTAQSLGTIEINGGTIKAKGGTTTYNGSTVCGAAGIGGSAYGTTGEIHIRYSSPTVNATGGAGAAGIGGGTNGTVEEIRIQNGTVKATGMNGGAAIGTGLCDDSDYSPLSTKVEILGGDITANGNIGCGTDETSSSTAGTVAVTIWTTSGSIPKIKLVGGEISTANYVTVKDGEYVSCDGTHTAETGHTNVDDGTHGAYCDVCCLYFTESHTPIDDDGNCLTAITCSKCGATTTAARTSHKADDDGDCITEAKCKYCDQIVREAQTAHSYDNATYQTDNSRHWRVCTNEGCEATETAEHTWDEGFCTVCGYEHVNHSYGSDGKCACGIYSKPEQAEDGYWEISTYEELNWFRQYVNEGNYSAKARLIADITATGTWTPIGSDKTSAYRGTFDGNYHAITNLTVSGGSIKNLGMFGYLYSATVKNLQLIGGSITSTEAITARSTGSIAGRAWYSTISNCSSTMTISNGYGNPCGIVGVMLDQVTISNCYFAGSVSVTASDYTAYAITEPRNKGTFTVTNCYYLSTCGGTASYDAVSKTADEFASGEVAYLLNGSQDDDGTLIWKQTIGTDAYPNFTGGLVKKDGDTYTNSHVHSWSSEWTKNATAHWHECTADNCPYADDYSKTPASGYAEHKGTDDGDCTTGVACAVCEKVYIAACADHVAAADDGDCTTDVLCGNDGCTHVMTEGKASHTPEADDGDCTTEITCANENCNVVTTAAKEHSYTDNCDTTCDNEGCTYTREAPHTYTDDGNCRTALVCEDCGEVLIAAKARHSVPHITDCTQEYICENESCTQVVWVANDDHEMDLDDGDCTTAIKCADCDKVMEEGKTAHSFTNACDTTCNNDGCEYTRETTHVPNDDDGDCTTDVVCSICGEVTTAACENHSFTNYIENSPSYFDGYTKTAACDHEGCTVTDTQTASTEAPKDTTAPTGTVTIGKYFPETSTLADSITYKTYTNSNKVELDVSANDDSYTHSGYTSENAVKIAYYLDSSGSALTAADLESKVFTDYTAETSVSLSSEGSYVIYVKLTDWAENVTYLSSAGIVYDTTAPTITGVTDGAEYSEAVTITVSDDTLLDSIYLYKNTSGTGRYYKTDMTEKSCTFTIYPTSEVKGIDVMDKAGNYLYVDFSFTSESYSGDTYKYTVTFDLNGHGTGEAPAAQSVYFNGTVSYPTEPTDNDYDFVNWYKDSACTEEWEFSGSTPDAVYEDITLYAKWTKTSEDTPTAQIDYESERLTGLAAGAVYLIGDTEYTADADGKIAIDSAWTGTTISIVKKSSDDSLKDSNAQSLDIPARPSAPNVTIDSETGILSTTTEMEYQIDGGTWTDCTVNMSIADFGGGTQKVIVKFRTKATSTSCAGEELTLTLPVRSSGTDTPDSDSGTGTGNSSSGTTTGTKSETGAANNSSGNSSGTTGTQVKDESGLSGNDLASRSDLPLLLAKGKQSGKKNIKLTWNKVSGATGYEVYWSYCGKKQNYSKLQTVKAGAKCTATHKKLKKNKAYKYFITAYKMVDGKKIYLSRSPEIHVAMKYEKKTNAKKITVNKSSVTLKRKKTFKIKAKIKSENSKKKLLAHAKKLRYYTTNSKVATVSKSGKIKAKAKGSCFVYVIANNGVYKKIKVKVK